MNPLNNTEQIFKTINENKSALILLSKNYNGDAISSALALSLYLKKYGKKAVIALENIENIDKKYKFLPEIDLITNKVFDPSKFTIKIKTNRIKAKELSYEPKDDSIEIYITSATNDGFKKDDVEIIEKNISFDFVFSIGAKSKNEIGLYNENIEFTEGKTLINLDISQKNEKFGTINIIEANEKTLSELVFDVISFDKSELIDENIANCILTGIIDKTNGLKAFDITSSTLSNASNLIDLGADKDIISKNLFRTKNFEEIKNTATIFSNTKNIESTIVYSMNENLDDNFNIKSIFNDSISCIDGVEVFIIFNKKNDIIYSQIITSDKYSASEISSDFRSIGNDEIAQFAIASPDINKVVEIVLNKIKQKIKKTSI